MVPVPPDGQGARGSKYGDLRRGDRWNRRRKRIWQVDVDADSRRGVGGRLRQGRNHRTVGWCPQEPRLYDRLTVAETFHIFGEAYDMTHDEIRDARDRFADTLDFERFLDYQVRHLVGVTDKRSTSASL